MILAAVLWDESIIIILFSQMSKMRDQVICPKWHSLWVSGPGPAQIVRSRILVFHYHTIQLLGIMTQLQPRCGTHSPSHKAWHTASNKHQYLQQLNQVCGCPNKIHRQVGLTEQDSLGQRAPARLTVAGITERQSQLAQLPHHWAGKKRMELVNVCSGLVALSNKPAWGTSN